jgi:hypothetical protein
MQSVMRKRRAADVLFNWDHFFRFSGEPNGNTWSDRAGTAGRDHAAIHPPRPGAALSPLCPLCQPDGYPASFAEPVTGR